MDWIKCSERLPVNGQTVAVSGIDCNGNRNQWALDWNDTNDNVTQAWLKRWNVDYWAIIYPPPTEPAKE